MTRKTADKPRSVPPLQTSGGQAAAPATHEATSEIKTPNAAKGTPQRLTAQLFDTLCADFEAHGADAIRCCREEQPQGYLRLIAGLLPKEFDLNDNRLKDIPDDELDILIELSRERAAQSQGASGPGEGKGPAAR
jgi:hypothetical protein